MSATPQRPAPLDADAIQSLRDLDYCYLTTTGRRTGRPHTIEIWFGCSQGRLYLLAGGGEGADWVRNLLADRSVTLRLGERECAATARPVTDPAEDSSARRLLAAKYQGWREGQELSSWAGGALAVAVEPESAG
ncbi:MAG TPA: nitroreductase family deazaflavin-dependent oxidoreductase [Egibacteraceae bacterium]|nr:nitroreductase family deazaflavin-dependent oxidoreductase [Egibacteraceae bacterium]